MRIIFTFLVLMLLSSTNCSSLTPENFDQLIAYNDIKQKDVKNKFKSRKAYPSINTTEILLVNGMKVILKPTSEEEDEIIIKFFAPGGFASLPPNLRASGEFSEQIAWKSGFGDVSADHLEAIMYEHQIDLSSKVEAYSRSIEGIANSKNIAWVLKLVNLYFTQSNFSEEGMASTIELQSKQIKKIPQTESLNIENAYLAINTQNYESLKPVSLKDIKNADFSNSKKFFEEAFKNPADFTCVIVGDFELGEMENWIALYLGEIPSSDNKFSYSNQKFPEFPNIITKQSFQVPGQKNCLTRMTFKVEADFDSANVRLLRYGCELIENRLKLKLKSIKTSIPYSDAYSVYPCYPFLDKAWLTIEFHSAPKDIDTISQTIVACLKDINTQPFKKTEVLEVKKLLRSSDARCQKDSYFWATRLASYGHWGWDLSLITQEIKESSEPKPKAINAFLEKSLILNFYTILSAKPL